MKPFTLSGYSQKLDKTIDYDLVGKMLAEESSHRDEHWPIVHARGEHAPIGERCPACRWFELRIYALEDGTWAVETVGASTVPGEVTKRQVYFCETPRRVVSCLVQSRGGDYFMPNTSLRALDTAADNDERLAPVVDVVVDTGSLEGIRDQDAASTTG